MIRETAALMGIAVGLPLLVHLIPATGIPWGARLLAMFYAPLLGVVLYRLHVGLIPAVLAPAINYMITGLPAPGIVAVLTIELVVFTLVVHFLIRKWPRLWVAGALAYVAAKSVSLVVITLVPWFADLRPAADFAVASLRTAVPGLLLLMAVTLLALQMRPRR